jgi:8-oxo-dGTP pyrophosphatase MutT (NUDIX family)
MVRVVVGALVRDHRVMLGHRSTAKRVNPGGWDLPGGVIEPGESELAALARELHEELGVQVATESVSHLCRVIVGPADGPVRLSAWLVRDWHGTPANVAPDEHDDLGWFGPEDLPSLVHADVRAAVVEAMGAHRAG